MKSYTKPSFHLCFTKEHLESIATDVLLSISRLWGGKGNESRASCVRRVLNGLMDASAMRAAMTGHDAETRAALAVIKEHCGAIRAGTLEAIMLAYGYPITHTDSEYGYGHDASRYAAKLINRGFLLCETYDSMYHSYGRYSGVNKTDSVYTDERLLAYIDWPVKVQPLPLSPVTIESATTTLRRPQHVLLDLMAIIQALADMKGLSLKMSGEVRLGDLRQFRKRLSWAEDQAFNGRKFPRIAEAFITTLERCGVLQSFGEVLTLSLAPEEFAQMPLPRQVSLLATGFIANERWNEKDDTFSYYMSPLLTARTIFFHSLRALPAGGQFYALDAFVEAVYHRLEDMLDFMSIHDHSRPSRYGLKEPEYQAALREWRRKNMPRLVSSATPVVEAILTGWPYWLGLIELGTLAEGSPALRLTELGEAIFADDGSASSWNAASIEPDSGRPAWVVQPNYDIVVYLEAISPAQLAFLEQHAERRQMETHTAHYRLTRESVYRGLEGGATFEDMLATLRDGGQADLPQNVDRELREWAEQRKRMTIRTSARLIAFPTPETRSLAMEAGLEGAPVGETYVLVKEGAQIKAALKSVFGLQAIPTIDYTQPPAKCLLIEEDGTLKLEKDTGDLLIRGQLARCAEPVDAAHWRITAASLKALRKAGGTPGMLLAFLRARAEHDVPAMLEIAIGNTLGARDVVQAETVFLLRVTDKKLYTAITTSPSLKPFLLDVPGPDTIAVSLARLEEFKAKLDWLGVKLAPFTPVENRPDWRQTVRDAKIGQRQRYRY